MCIAEWKAPLGRERTEEIIRRRPWSDVNNLQKIADIGPQRLQDIGRQASVQWISTLEAKNLQKDMTSNMNVKNA